LAGGGVEVLLLVAGVIERQGAGGVEGGQVGVVGPVEGDVLGQGAAAGAAVVVLGEA